jgi:hypothetical protein
MKPPTAPILRFGARTEAVEPSRNNEGKDFYLIIVPNSASKAMLFQ